MWIQLPRPLFSLTKGLCFGALSHLALIISHEGSSLTTTLGYLLWQIWEGAWKKGWVEERVDEVDPPPSFLLLFFDKCIRFPQRSSKPASDLPLDADGNDFLVAILLDWTEAYFRSLQSLLKEGRKKSPALDLPWPVCLKITSFTTTHASASWPARTDMFSFPFQAYSITDFSS